MRENIIFGKNPVLEAIEGKRQFEKILVAKGNPVFQEIYRATKGMNVRVQVVPEEKLNRITRKNHQGVVAYVGLVDYQSVENVLASIYEQGETPLFIVLDGVTDVGNLGAIARSAYCMGAQAIIVPEKGSALINGVAVKASAGALEKINVCRVSSLNNVLQELQQNGLSIYATALSDTAKEVQTIDFTVPCCIVMGNEEKGVGKNICAMANETVYIPMAKNFDSLNVSVATGVVLHEVHKQRREI